MNSEKLHTVISPVLIILIAVVLRLVPHPANVAPIAAMALFGGAYLDKRYALVFPIAAMFVSDLFLGFHDTMLFVYGSFLLTGLLGLWLRNYKSIPAILLASAISSVLFFLITNFGVWLMGTMYVKSIDGLLEAYTMGLPFFRNTMIGDLLYTSLFFGSFAVMKAMLKKPLPAKHM